MDDVLTAKIQKLYVFENFVNRVVERNKTVYVPILHVPKCPYAVYTQVDYILYHCCRDQLCGEQAVCTVYCQKKSCAYISMKAALVLWERVSQFNASVTAQNIFIYMKWKYMCIYIYI